MVLASVFLPRRRRRPAGFTLVELLIAMSITSLLVVLLLKAFSATATSWRSGETQVDAYREARGALQLMARDLSTTLQPSYASYSTVNSGVAQPALLPTLVLSHYPAPDPAQDTSGTAVPAGDNNNEEVYCLTNIAAPTAVDQLCAVGYFCQWMPDMAPAATKQRAPRAWALMRQYLNSADLYKNLQAASAAQPASPAPQLPLKFIQIYARASLSPTPAPTPVGSTPLAASTQLAAYVWDLKVRIDTSLTAVDGENPPPKDHSTPSPIAYDGASITSVPPALPSFVEIRFKALSALAARRLESAPNVTRATWDSPGDSTYQAVILPGAQQFVMRVPLSNGPAPTP